MEDIDFCKNIGLDWSLPTDEDAVRYAIESSYESEKPIYVRV